LLLSFILFSSPQKRYTYEGFVNEIKKQNPKDYSDDWVPSSYDVQPVYKYGLYPVEDLEKDEDS